MANDVFVRSQPGCFAIAAREQVAMENATAHLYKSSFTSPSPATPLSDFVAAECDFDNYSAKTLATWPNLVAALGTGALIFTAMQVWVWSNTGGGVGNTVGGMFLVDSGGELIGYVQFGSPVPMQGPNQSLQRTPGIIFPNT